MDPIAGAGIDLGQYSDELEEAVTIRGVENSLRTEHGITARHSHHNVLSLAADVIKESLNKAGEASDKLPNKVSRPIQIMLNNVNDLASNRQIKEAEKALVLALKALHDAEAKIALEQKAPVVAAKPTNSWFADFVANILG